MKLFDMKNKRTSVTADALREFSSGGQLFVICKTGEVHELKKVFSFDESTVIDCTDLDESVRYSSFDGYDFISLVHLERWDKSLTLREINIYVSRGYLVLVMPEHKSPRLSRLENEIMETAENMGEKHNPVNRLYFLLFHKILSDFSEMLEAVEDEIEALSQEVAEKVDASHITGINRFHRMTYTARKQIRSLSYLGEQILVDENGVIEKNQIKYFRNLDTRLKKLYDFSASLYDLSGALISTYDSKLSAKTNDIVTKLTLLTLFFSPLTLISGIYGMNFVFMPELKMPYAYPATLLVMALIVTGLYIFAKRKKLL